MVKGKPRKYPDKPQIDYGPECRYRDTCTGGCERLMWHNGSCNGDRHNCLSGSLKFMASLSPLKRIKEQESWPERN